MKVKKQLAAFLLSLSLLTGMAAPVFAVDSDTSSTQSTTSASSDQASDSTETKTDKSSDTSSDKTDDSAAQETEEQDPKNPTITIDAKASILVNAETGEIIEAKNEKKKEYPASTTKMMTALLALENCELSDVVTMKQEDIAAAGAGASNAGLKAGEQVTVENLLYCLMLPSAFEAANALARTAGGSVDNFVKMMNDRASELGCVNTHFVNPTGMHDTDHYSCAYDMYLIAREAMKNSTFQTIVNTAQKKLPETNMNPERIIYTTNELIRSSYSSIYYDNCYGIKTGHTTPAGYCLVSYAKQGSYSYYSVILGAKGGTEYAGSFTETKRLFEWAFDNFRMKTATKGGSAVTECPVRLGKGVDHVTLVTSKDVSVLLPKGAESSDLETKLDVSDSYDAPIAQGQKLGTVTYSYNGTICAKEDLIALSAVQRSTLLYALDQVSKFLHWTPVRILITIVIVLFILYVVFSVIARRNRRIKKQQRRKRKNRKHRNNRR